MGNAVNRTLDLPCARPTTTAPAFETLYFVTSRQDPPQFDFTKDLAPVAKVAASRIYALKNHGARINQEPTNILLSEQKVNYMTYLPARLEQGLNISLPMRRRPSYGWLCDAAGTLSSTSKTTGSCRAPNTKSRSPLLIPST